MKNAKKITAIILAIALALTLSLALFSCGNEESASGKMTLVVAGDNTEVSEVELDKISLDKGLVSVLDYLKAEGKLDYGITGSFLDYVGEVKTDAANGVYPYVYTTVDADKDVSEYTQTLEYEGITLTSVGKGALELTVEDGAVIYVTTIVYGS